MHSFALLISVFAYIPCGLNLHPQAVKWLGMGPSSDRDASRSSDRMFVSQEAATEVLQPLGDQQINLISIFGAARQGKSFLMNLLADQQDLFKISNLREPCTQGVDLSGHFIPLSDFSALNGCPPVTAKQSKQIQIGFVDAEGQGDRDITCTYILYWCLVGCICSFLSTVV